MRRNLFLETLYDGLQLGEVLHEDLPGLGSVLT